MHVDTCHPLKPQRPRLGRPCNEQAPPNPFFDFVKVTRASKKPLYSHGSTQIRISSPHFALLSLKERARSSLESSLKPTGQHLKRKINLHIISSSYSLKEIRNQETQDSLKLSTSNIFGSSHQKRDILSCKSDSIPIFPPRTRNLVRVLATLILEYMISSWKFQ